MRANQPELSNAEIGRQFGISGQRVSQILSAMKPESEWRKSELKSSIPPRQHAGSGNGYPPKPRLPAITPWIWRRAIAGQWAIGGMSIRKTAECVPSET